jgi:hypothetical protein
MIKATKYIILTAGVIGLISFFMPLISVSKAGITGKLSAYRIVKGIDSAKDIVGKAGKNASAETDKKVVADANKALGALKAIVLAVFFPAMMIFLLGLVGTLRKSFGRGLAIPTFLFGLVGLAISGLLTAVASSDGGQSVAGSGMYMLLFASVVGTVFALIGIIKPDRKAVAQANAPQLATSPV